MLRPPAGVRKPPSLNGGGLAPRRSTPVALLVAMRPRQWVKNLLVFAAPAAAGVLFHAAAIWRSLGALAVFVAASAATYLVNDIVDRDADRLHPVKRLRPITSGEISPRLALGVSGALLAGAAAGAALIAGGPLLAVIAAYVVITLSYSLGLKRAPVLELACVASGFVLRAIAGATAVRVPLSPWFLLVTSFGALFIVAGKRSAEASLLGEERVAHRAALGGYPAAFLRTVRTLSASVAVTAYCLWAFERTAHSTIRNWSGHLIWFELSIVPFLLAVLAVELAVDKGRGGEPEELALRDHLLQGLGAAWVTLILIGIYS